MKLSIRIIVSILTLFSICQIGYSQTEANDRKSTIRLAASNSCQQDKDRADILCDGNNDECELRKAIELVQGKGRIELASGTYSIDSFNLAEDGTGYVVKIGYRSNIQIVGDIPDWGRTGARLVVSEKCYELLDNDTLYSVICGTPGDFKQTMSQNIEIANISISLPGNQKKIICIDGYNTGRISVNRCICSGPKNNRETDITLGVMDCIGIRGLKGSNNGTATEFNNCSVTGLGIGFALSGEHLILISSTSIGCRYGFTFNQYPNNFENTAQVHPITLIGCHDEVSANYPRFYENSLGQSIRFINFAIEHYPKNFSYGGEYATETTPGQWHGIIDYSIQNFNTGEEWIRNSATLPFWANGSGIAVQSHNNTHKSIVTSEERRSYSPNFGQVVYDTDLRKSLTCIDPQNKVWVTSKGRKVK